eukprot:SAG11_NODE_3053_length_2722_cov_3.880853_2_plen_88_part_00
MDATAEVLVLVAQYLDQQGTVLEGVPTIYCDELRYRWGALNRSRVREIQQIAIAIPKYYGRLKMLNCLIEFRTQLRRGEYKACACCV